MTRGEPELGGVGRSRTLSVKVWVTAAPMPLAALTWMTKSPADPSAGVPLKGAVPPWRSTSVTPAGSVAPL